MRRPWSRTVPDGAWDVVVVGSGIAGLTTAAMLSKKGLRVLVLEQHHTPGGLIQTFTRGPFRFDTGLHVLGELEPDGLPARLFDALSDGAIRFASLGPLVDRLHTDAGIIDLPAGAAAVAEALEARFPGSRRGVRAYLDAAERGSRDAGLALLARHLPSAMGGVLDGQSVARGEQILARTAEDWLDEWLPAGPVRDVLAVRGGYHGTPLGQASAGAHAAVTHHYTAGAWTPVPDARTITRGLCGTVARAGGWTAVGQPVVAVDCAAGRVSGVRLADGRTVPTGRVVAAMPVHRALDLVDGPYEWSAPLRALPMSLSHVGLYLGLDRDPVAFGATRASHWAAFDDPEVQGIYARFPTVGGPGPHRATVTAVVAGPIDAQVGRHGGRPASYRARKAAIQERLLARTAEILPGIESAIVLAELSTPATTEHFAAAPSGAMYGLAASVERFTCPELRATTPIEGFFLGGTDVGMSGVIGGLMAGVHSAVAVHPRAVSLLARARVGDRPRRRAW